jgi:hypothetical protein
MDDKTNDEIKNLSVGLIDAVMGGIPIVSTGYGIAKTISAHWEAIFYEKLEAFMRGRGQVTDEEAKRFLKSLDEDPEEFKKRLWTCIERMESKEKTEILGRVFRGALITGLPGSLYLELAFMIDSCHLKYLKYFLAKHWEKDQGIEPESVTLEFQRRVLSNLGFLKENATSTNSFGDAPVKYEYEESHLGGIILSCYTTAEQNS